MGWKGVRIVDWLRGEGCGRKAVDYRLQATGISDIPYPISYLRREAQRSR